MNKPTALQNRRKQLDCQPILYYQKVGLKKYEVFGNLVFTFLSILQTYLVELWKSCVLYRIFINFFDLLYWALINKIHIHKVTYCG